MKTQDKSLSFFVIRHASMNTNIQPLRLDIRERRLLYTGIKNGTNPALFKGTIT